MLRTLMAFTAAMACGAALAGGSFEPVYIKRLSIVNGVEYELVVTPLKVVGRDGDLDPYMGQCATRAPPGSPPM